MHERYIERGLVVGIGAACYGIWLVWCGIQNDLWYSRFGEPVIPRWLYLVGGITIAGLSMAYVLFLLHVKAMK